MQYSVAHREQALDFMDGWPEYGEQRWYSDALGTEQVSFSWRRMLPGTGGRGSYGHRHPGQEEVYFVISGTVTSAQGTVVSGVTVTASAELLGFNDGFAHGPNIPVRRWIARDFFRKRSVKGSVLKGVIKGSVLDIDN